MLSAAPLAPRRATRPVKVGPVTVGGDAPISVQSMCNTDTRDVETTIQQVYALAEAGADIVRLAVPDEEAAEAFGKIKRRSPVPLVADIHFHYKLALLAARQGADKLRLNPGNIGSQERVRAVVDEARGRGIPIRIGVNGGSLEKDLLARYGSATPEAMVESGLRHVAILEREGFEDIIISLKASDVPRMVTAYRLMAQRVPYPLHLGVTEAGPTATGAIKSAIGIGLLLAEGIGDTIRCSLTDPKKTEEVRVGIEILKSLGLRTGGPIMVSCPSCGRAEVNLEKLAAQVETVLKTTKKNVHVSVMGCVVNGPGEAREADLAVVGGRAVGLLLKKGRIVAKFKEDELVPALLKELEAWPDPEEEAEGTAAG